MTSKLAWKNIWRNRTRSLIFIAATLFGLATAIFAIHLMKAISGQRLADAINIQTGHLQVHRPGFAANKELELFLPDAADLARRVAAVPGVAAVSTRLVATGMLASPDNSVTCDVTGVDPAQERRVSILDQYLMAGQYLTGVKRNPILISRKTAAKLHLKLQSKLVLTVKDARGEIVGGLFRVAGIYETPNRNFDENAAFVVAADLQALTQAGGAHELAVKLTDAEQLPAVAAAVQRAAPGLTVETWKDVLPELSSFSGFIDTVSTLFTIIILLGLGFGLLNTMNMIVQERTHEMGMLRAIGQGRWSVFRMLLQEAGLMTLLGAVGGVLLGVSVVKIASATGIHFGDSLQAAMGIRGTLHPALNWGLLPAILLLTLVLTSLIAVLPASRALRIQTSTALRD